MMVFIYTAYLTYIIFYATLLFVYNSDITRKSNSQRTYVCNFRVASVFVYVKRIAGTSNVDFRKRCFYHINRTSLVLSVSAIY